MSKRTWKSGPPPSVGWWPASWNCTLGAIRWWNGEWWSVAANPTTVAKIAGRIALAKAEDQDEIEWTDRWWL